MDGTTENVCKCGMVGYKYGVGNCPVCDDVFYGIGFIELIKELKKREQASEEKERLRSQQGDQGD